jgi:translation initiation factor IF-3
LSLIRQGRNEINNNNNNRKSRREPPPNINERLLRFGEIRVINADGDQIGIMTSRKALDLALEDGLDLILIAESAKPPVCKIADYGKHKYIEAKRKKTSNSKKPQETKSLKISPRISDHDLGITAKKASNFLEHGDKVRLMCLFKARELSHPALGKERLAKLIDCLSSSAIPEGEPLLEGKVMAVVLRPKDN